jgi:hypothetical protein
MTILILKDRTGQIINDWTAWTPPKQLHHWKAGRSAMELARCWFKSGTPQCPPELEALLATNTYTTNLEFDEGYPEFVTALPERGEGRNHDLMLKAHTPTASGVVGIEAKVDEPFGKKIGEYWQEAKASTKPTRVPERIQALLEIVFGAQAQPDVQPWCDLRYQLLTAVAGTLLQAANEQVPLAIFVVHEFPTVLAKPQLMKANADDYARFVEILFSIPTVNSGQMYGPLQVQAGSHLARPEELFVGKVTGNYIYPLLPFAVARQMISEGESEELFTILLSEYEYLKSKNLGHAMFRYHAQEIDYKWVRANPHENSKNRMRLLIEKDIPDLWNAPPS